MMRQGIVPAGVGMTLGLGLALLATRGLSNFLYGVSPFDPAITTKIEWGNYGSPGLGDFGISGVSDAQA